MSVFRFAAAAYMSSFSVIVVTMRGDVEQGRGAVRPVR
jgi:hypothetical protein